MKLREYQEVAIKKTSILFANGAKKAIFQLPTGGGKTVCFSEITKRYIERSGKSVLILVDRKELLNQTVATLFNHADIVAWTIIAGRRYIPESKCYVGMVESVNNRISQLKNIGLVIIDEAHKLSFAKMHEHFPDSLILGFTATPLTANKKKPLKNYYEKIICGIDIPDLIAQGSLSQNITYAPKEHVDTSSLKIKNGEYDESEMAKAFSEKKHISNTVNAYLKYSPNTKCLVFNCNIEHAILVNEAFNISGVVSKIIHSNMDVKERDAIVRWYIENPSAVLNNVSILTTGFDCPDTETIIMNRATLSMPLWLQCCGRGGRVTQTKSAFKIIDFGNNALTHGDWSSSRNWEDIFYSPEKASKKAGVAPVKNCYNCDAIIAARSNKCAYCGQEFASGSAAIIEAGALGEFAIVTKGIDVIKIINQNKEKKEYFPFFNIAKRLANGAADTMKEVDAASFGFILSKYNDLAKIWCKEKGKPFNEWHKKIAKDTLISELSKKFKHDENWVLQEHQ
jgi:superfamily II DNA or RNA helicase